MLRKSAELDNASQPADPSPLPTAVAEPASPAVEENTLAIPGLNPDCIKSDDDLKKELTRLKSVFENDKSRSPYQGSTHEMHQALSDAVDALIMGSKESDKRKSELLDIASKHPVFGHRRFPLIKNSITFVVGLFKANAHPVPTKSQCRLIASKEALDSKILAEQAAKP